MSYLVTFCLVIVVFAAKTRELEMEYRKQKGIILAAIITAFFAIIRLLINLLVGIIF